MTSLTQDIFWLGMRLQVPADWEVVRHATDPRQGSLMMVDRRHQRLQLSWQQVAREPDLEQMIEDYRNRDLQEHRGVRHKRVACDGGWLTLRRSRADAHLTRAVRFENACGRLVELVLPWPEAPQGELESAILRGYQLEDPSGLCRHWRAFGLDVEVPQGWKLHAAQIEPGSAHMRFTQGRSESLIRRLGAVSAWFNGRLEEFVARQVQDDSVTARAAEYHHHPACELETREPGTRWQRWTGKLRNRFDLAWFCPTDHAVYHLMTLAHDREQTWEPRDFVVGCCRGGPSLGRGNEMR